MYVTTEEPTHIEVSPEIAALLQVGLDQIDRGETVPWNQEIMEQWLRDRAAERAL